MQQFNIKLLIASIFLATNITYSYPLDGYEETGISRLEGYLFSLQTKSGQTNIVKGSRLKSDSFLANLRGINFSLPNSSIQFSAALKKQLGSALVRGGSVSLLDLTNISNPELALVNPSHHFIPASVGKIVVALGWFHVLKELFPNDTKARINLLKNSSIRADKLIEGDHHEVSFWNRESGEIYTRHIQIGELANVYTYLDWMISNSSNAAGTVLMKELILLINLGKNYQTTSPEVKESIWKTIPKAKRSSLLSQSIKKGLILSGLNPNLLYQGSPFTKLGKSEIPSTGSTATTLELVRFMIQMERAQLVDPFSSREIKRLLYITQDRPRLASSSLLDNAAVYYKSGSNYKCGYPCEENEGDVLNIMNSVGVIEYPVEDPKITYIVALHTNVPRVNAVKLHRELGSKIQELMLQKHKMN